jgi:hypothetical protein
VHNLKQNLNIPKIVVFVFSHVQEIMNLSFPCKNVANSASSFHAFNSAIERSQYTKGILGPLACLCCQSGTKRLEVGTAVKHHKYL